MTTSKMLASVRADPALEASRMEDRDLARIILKAQKAYHEGGKTLFSDDTYDILVEELRKRNPSHPVLANVGSRSAKKDKVRLPVYMGSLTKFKGSDADLRAWLSSLGQKAGPLVVSDKMDGVAALYTVGPQQERRLYTRGNGRLGRDVSHLLPYVRGLPPPSKDHLPSLWVRGELVMPRAAFSTAYAGRFANARNTVSGVVNADAPDASVARAIAFVAHAWLGPDEEDLPVRSQQLQRLAAWGFDVVHHERLSFDSGGGRLIDRLSELLSRRRAAAQFDVDGLVLTDDSAPHLVEAGKNPDWELAFKLLQTEDSAEVVLTGVEWNASKDGYLKPVALFEPTPLSGANLSRASAFNGKFVRDHRLGPGSHILVKRSGDVIPHIVEVLSPAATGSPQMPDTEYEWTESGVDVVAVDPATLERVRIERFFTALEIPGWSHSTVRRLSGGGLDTIGRLWNARWQDIAGIDGFGEKSAKKLAEALDARKKTLSCFDVMVASNAFGRGIGHKKLQAIERAFPRAFRDLTAVTVPVRDLKTVDGIDDLTAQKIHAGFAAYGAFLEQHGLPRYACEDTNAAHDNAPPTMRVAFSGFRDAALEKAIADAGGIVVDRVAADTMVLVVQDTGETTKTKRAKALGVPIESKAEFLRRVK